ncbi:MAG: hypothetical protein QOD65_3474, partial [Gaiellales bacterium]|nr:hypothetical protein [Gaiellales bacterium]
VTPEDPVVARVEADVAQVPQPFVRAEAPVTCTIARAP